MKRTKSNSAGFTLIELLIVIIIIGILAAIAFVAYSGSQNKANKAKAQSTISQVANKLAEYNASNSNYPLNTAAISAYMTSAAGGNNTALNATYTSGGYTYTPSPTGCDNSATPCTGYTLTAAGTLFGGTSPANDITQTN